MAETSAGLVKKKLNRTLKRQFDKGERSDGKRSLRPLAKLAAGMRVRAPLQEYSWSRTSLGPARLSDEAVVAAVCESETGTFETCRRMLRMSVYRGRPEVIGAPSQ
jgi:hypothetical protein